MPPTASDKAAADGLRVEGNALFAKGKYGAALEVRAPPSCALHDAHCFIQPPEDAYFEDSCRRLFAEVYRGADTEPGAR